MYDQSAINRNTKRTRAKAAVSTGVRLTAVPARSFEGEMCRKYEKRKYMTITYGLWIRTALNALVQLFPHKAAFAVPAGVVLVQPVYLLVRTQGMWWDALELQRIKASAKHDAIL